MMTAAGSSVPGPFWAEVSITRDGIVLLAVFAAVVPQQSLDNKTNTGGKVTDTLGECN